MTVTSHEFYNTLQPVLMPILTAVSAAAVGLLARLFHTATGRIKDDRIRRYVETLIQAADNSATDPITGPAKRVWVLERLHDRFPGLPATVAGALVDGIFQGLTSSATIVSSSRSVVLPAAGEGKGGVPLATVPAAVAPPPGPPPALVDALARQEAAAEAFRAETEALRAEVRKLGGAV